MAGLDADPTEGLSRHDLIGMLDKSVKEAADLHTELGMADMVIDEQKRTIERLTVERDELLSRLGVPGF